MYHQVISLCSVPHGWSLLHQTFWDKRLSRHYGKAKEEVDLLAPDRFGMSTIKYKSEVSKIYCSLAVRDKCCCRLNVGLSLGPKTKEGRKRCGIAKTVHGGETRAIRAARPAKMAELKELGAIVNEWKL